MIAPDRAPAIHLDCPTYLVAGQVATLNWIVEHGDQARVFVDDELRSALLAGVIDLTLEHGRHIVSIVASGEGGRSERVLDLQVVAPPVVIEVDREVTAHFGEWADVRYVICGASRAWADQLDPREPAYLIPLAGTIAVQAGQEPERLRICAVGHDAQVSVATITVRALPCEPTRFSSGRESPHEAPPAP